MNKEYTTSNLPERGSMRTAVCGCETFIIISHAHATISFMNNLHLSRRRTGPRHRRTEALEIIIAVFPSPG